jgi:CheY-like chemotaxis protein
MGGHVGVETAPGEGSRFWADLPLPTARPVGERPDGASDAAAVLRGARVLLAEDNPVNTLVAETMLRQWGAHVTTVANGADALEAIERDADGFDIVLMDLQMPVLGGIEATIAIRRRHGPGALPIVALTADVLVSEREAALRHGMNDFLSKPIDPDRLAQTLARWLRAAG